MAMMDVAETTARSLPTIRSADWFIRLPLAVIIAEQGYLKFGDMALQAEGFGLPLWAFALAAIGEILGAAAILIGGFIRNNWMTDLLTRLGGFAIAGVVAGVIVMLYFGPFAGWQFQGMLLAGGLFFLFRGNGDVKGRALI